MDLIDIGANHTHESFDHDRNAVLQRAREAGVFVHESPELVSLLMQVDLDARIPPQLYVAVAELLAWLYRIEQGVDAGTAPVARELPESLRPRPAADDSKDETRT